MNGKALTSCLAILLFPAVGLSLDGAAPTPPPTVSTASSPMEIPPDLLRDPFWPIGWAPPGFGRVDQPGADEKSSAVIARWDDAAKQLQTTGISRLGKKYMAILRGIGLVEEGDIVAVNYNGLTYRWRIARITSEGIVPEKLTVTSSQ